MASQIKHLFITAELVQNEAAVAVGLIDCLDDRATGRLFASIVSNDHVKAVVRVAEDVVALVGIIEAARNRLTPSADPARVRR